MVYLLIASYSYILGSIKMITWILCHIIQAMFIHLSIRFEMGKCLFTSGASWFSSEATLSPHLHWADLTYQIGGYCWQWHRSNPKSSSTFANFGGDLNGHLCLNPHRCLSNHPPEIRLHCRIEIVRVRLNSHDF